jgi:hypothetical protein
MRKRIESSLLPIYVIVVSCTITTLIIINLVVGISYSKIAGFNRYTCPATECLVDRNCSMVTYSCYVINSDRIETTKASSCNHNETNLCFDLIKTTMKCWISDNAMQCIDPDIAVAEKQVKIYGYSLIIFIALTCFCNVIICKIKKKKNTIIENSVA